MRSNDPEGMRKRMLDAAADSFQSQGASETSMRDLRDLAGVTAGALYHHFPTKKELMIAVIEERVRAEIMSTWIETVVSAETAAEGILSVFDKVADDLEAAGSVSGCPLGNLATELALLDPDLRAAVATEYALWRCAIENRLRQDAANGLIAAHRIEALAYTVVAMFTGAMTIAKSEQCAKALRACSEQLRLLLR